MKVEFKYPSGIEAKCKYTGFTGLILGRVVMLNGCIQYNIHPPCSVDKDTGKTSTYIPEGAALDEASLVPTDGKTHEPETVEFKFETGDKVKSRITEDLTGTIIEMVYDNNGCKRVRVQGAKLDKDGKKHILSGFEQEFELVNQGLNAPTEKPIARAKTGCEIRKVW